VHELTFQNKVTQGGQNFLQGTKRREENSTLLGYKAASSGNSLSNFQGNISVPSSRVKSSRRKSVTLISGLCMEWF